MAWGNENGTTENQNLIPAAGRHNRIHVVDVDTNDVDQPAIWAVNNNVGANARALKVEGKAEIIRNAADETALRVSNTSLDAEARALVVDGRADFDGTMGLDGSLNISGPENGINGTDGQLWLGVGNVTNTVVISHNNGGQIRTLGNLRARGGVDGDENDLAIGTTANTDDITIGRIGQTCTFNSAVEIGADEDDPALLDAALDDADPRDLNIGTQASTGDITVGRDGKNLTVNSALIVGGAAAAVAKIDAELDGASARKLKIGTQNSTDNITVGRSGKTTHVDGAINVGQTAFVVGETSLAGNLKVGPTANAGTINSGGVAPAPLNLEVGTGAGTASVVMSRAGQTIDMFGQERLNSNACVLNGAANITAANGIGFVVNAAGHGNGSSIDFYINGQVQGWLDTTGFVNA